MEYVRAFGGRAAGRLWRLLAALSMLAALLAQPALLRAAQGQQFVTQEIRYHRAGAGEVTFVWGVDGWRALDAALRPDGTVINNGAMHTPMARQGNLFQVALKVPLGAAVNYGFLVVKDDQGAPIEPIWDDNGGPGYTTRADQGRTIDVEGRMASAAPAPPAIPDAPLVTQELRYHLPEAGEVSLVWGVNEWQALPEKIRPPATVINDNVMSTPMQSDGATFSARVRVPAGSKLNYGFLITKKRNGAQVGVWDSGGDQGFATQATQDAVVDVQSSVSLARENETASEFNLGAQLLVVMLGMALLAVAFARVRLAGRGVLAGPAQTIVCAGVMLWLIMLPIRANILNFGWISPAYSIPLIPATLWAGYYDLLFVGGITLFFSILAWLLRSRSKAAGALVWSYMALALVVLLIAISNTKVVAMLGRPFNYQWLYYSDFLGSTEAQSAIISNVSARLVVHMAVLGVVLVGGGYALSYVVAWMRSRAKSRLPANLVLVGALIAYVPTSHWQIAAYGWEYSRLANPIVDFVESVFGAQATPGFFTMALPAGSQDEFTAKPALPPGPAVQPRGGAQVKNVVLFVMESVAAEYVDAYGGKHSVTPVLDRYRSQSLLFENIYAHAPASNQSLVSLLGSIYPWISYRSLTEEYSNVGMPTLSSELKRQGYRTSFFSAADTRFQGGDEFLSFRQFDTVADFRSPQCAKRQFQIDPSKEWSYMDGANEECLVTSLDDWLGQDSSTPFFSMLWTVQTHYPYIVDGKGSSYSWQANSPGASQAGADPSMGQEIDYGVNDPWLNRYLNALHHSDMVLGQLLQQIERRGLSDSTLVVVVGDHGEAFGRHNQRGHGASIYDENIHVPLFFIQPRLFDGAKRATLGGLIDIAPTIMHLLGKPAPEAWQGLSLFSGQRSGRVYFTAPWSDFLFGYHEGDMKVIVNATKNTSEVYNLAKDPLEQNDLAAQSPDLVASGYQHLAAWVQYHDQYMKRLLGL